MNSLAKFSLIKSENLIRNDERIIDFKIFLWFNKGSILFHRIQPCWVIFFFQLNDFLNRKIPDTIDREINTVKLLDFFNNYKLFF